LGGGNSESGDRYEIRFWYEGVGEIKSLEGKLEKFLIKTYERRDDNFKNINESFHLDYDNVINERKIYALFLDHIWNCVLLNTDNKIIPFINLKEINFKNLYLDDLIEKGYVAEKDGSIKLNFGGKK
jgi:hypothetical protein